MTDAFFARHQPVEGQIQDPVRHEQQSSFPYQSPTPFPPNPFSGSNTSMVVERKDRRDSLGSGVGYGQGRREEHEQISRDGML